jgi:hypothetical protein
MTNRNSEPGAPTANTFRVVQIQTTASAGLTHLVVRNAKGRKLFDMDIPGVTIVLSVPLNATIEIEPDEDQTEEIDALSEPLKSIDRPGPRNDARNVLSKFGA